MNLGVFLKTTGHHFASWRHPDVAADAGISLKHHVEMARTAERGKLDMVFVADMLSMRDGDMAALSRSENFIATFDPLTLVTALSMVTERIGLVVTASTSYSQPYQVARTFASLDHQSGGRAGWNIVTSGQHSEAQNFGRDLHYGHEERYRRAKEFTDVVLGLWDSWDDDAFVRDKDFGIFFDPDKLHTLDHKGEFFQVKGPLTVPRPPQGYPVLVQAGNSEDGIAFAAQFAEVVFTSPLTFQQAKTYADELRRRTAEFGRNPADVKIMPGLNAMVGRTSAEADEKLERLNSMMDPIVARDYLSMVMRTDLAQFPFDRPLPALPVPPNVTKAFFNWVDLGARENLSIRDLSMRVARGRMQVTKGSPQEIADFMEEWVRGGACDGFNLMPPILPDGLTEFVDLVIPELQRRGLFRTEYEGRTFRDHLGLRRPASRYSEERRKRA